MHEDVRLREAAEADLRECRRQLADVLRENRELRALTGFGGREAGMRCDNCTERIPYEALQLQVRVYRHGGAQESYRLCSLECMGFWLDGRRGKRSEG